MLDGNYEDGATESHTQPNVASRNDGSLHGVNGKHLLKMSPMHIMVSSFDPNPG